MKPTEEIRNQVIKYEKTQYGKMEKYTLRDE